jgi:hypothetical protein
MPRLVLTALVLLTLSTTAPAHPADGPRSPEDLAVERQVLEFREMHKQAIGAKDLVKLRAVYADSYTHTHGSGKMDPKDARIVSALAGEPLIEAATVEELSVRVFGPATAIVTGKSPILNRQENKTYDFRWICVYVKSGPEWQLAASQATRLPGPGR